MVYPGNYPAENAPIDQNRDGYQRLDIFMVNNIKIVIFFPANYIPFWRESW